MSNLKEIEAAIGGYDLSHLSEVRLSKFELKLKRLGDASLSPEEQWKIKLDLAQVILKNKAKKT
jgi:hypothetical protein